MAQASNIVIADAQATPVNHTFVPIGSDAQGTYWFEDQSAANALGFWRISVQRTAPNSNVSAGTSSATRLFKYRIGLHLPVLETLSNSTVTGIAPAPTLAYVERFVAEFYSPERAAAIDRANVSKMAPLLLQNSQIVSLIQGNLILQ